MTPHPRLSWILLLAAAGCAASHRNASLSGPGHPLVVHTDPKLIEMSADPTQTLVLADSTNELAVRFHITARALPEAQRPPLDLGLVLDTSGSMQGASIEAVRASARELVHKLRDGDRISIVSFDSTAHVLVPNVRVDAASRARIADAIAHLVPRGTTALAEGLAAGLTQVLADREPGAIERLVLLSDGVPNSALGLPQLAQQIRANGISVTTLGLGLDYDTSLMTELARDSGGSFTYIDRPERVAEVFDHELAKMTTVVGRNLQLALEPGPGVTIEPMPGLNAAGDGRWYAMVGDLPAGETRDLMIPVRVAARSDGSPVELVEGTLAFEDVIGGSGEQQRDAYVGLQSSGDAKAVKASIVLDLEAARVRAAAAAATLEAMAMARTGQVPAARQRIASAIAAVRAARASTGDASLQQVIDQLTSIDEELAQVRPVAVIGQDTGDRPSPVPAKAPAAVEPELREAEQAAEATVQGR